MYPTSENLFTLVVLILTCSCVCFAFTNVTIGALFEEDSHLEALAFRYAIQRRNMFSTDLRFRTNIQIVPKSDAFKIKKILCDMTLSEEGIAAIFGPQSPKMISTVQAISEHLEIPHIQTKLRPSSAYNSYMMLNMHPDPNKFQTALGGLMRRMDWKSFTVLYEDFDSLARLQEILKISKRSENIKKNPVRILQIESGSDYRLLLKELKNSSETHFVLDCHTDRIMDILSQAKLFNLLDINYNYLLTSLDAHTLDYSLLDTRANITTIRIVDPLNPSVDFAVKNWKIGEEFNHRYLNLTPETVTTDMALMHDALNLFMESFEEVHLTQEVRTKRLKCDEDRKWEDGLRILQQMKTHDLKNGITTATTFENKDKFRWFDDRGRRTWFQLQIVEVADGKKNVTAVWTPEDGNNITMIRPIKDQDQQMFENLQKTLMIVSSRIGKPYLDYRTPKPGEILEGNSRYEGYSMDLISEIAKELNFKFQFKLAEDNNYGKFDPKTGSWNGLIKDLLDKKAHLAICDLTITRQRREVVDFSQPFMTLGVSILYRKPPKQGPNIFAFMAPLEFEVWIYIATLYLGTSIALYFIARMAPGDWEKPHPCDPNPEELENIWGVKNCLWLMLGSIMQQGCDILPKGISSRMNASMWWFFSLIITSSYTANLAAFLTTERLGPQIDSAEALSKQTKIKYGLVEGGATEEFFKETNFTTYQRMWTQMKHTKPSVFEKTNDDGIKRVLATKDQRYAFLMESSTIEYIIERNCDLKQVGSRLDTKHYGIAMPMEAPYRTAINKVILKLQENMKLEQLKEKWWKTGPDVKKCGEGINAADSSASASELALANVGGVFLLLGAGIGTALCIAVLEFLWNVRNVSVEEHITYWEALILEIKFSVNVCNTKKRVKPLISENSSVSQNEDSKSIAQKVLQGAGSFLNLDVFDKISVKRNQ